MESEQRQSLSSTQSSDEAERPESPLTGLEFDMARLSLEAQNDGLREKVHELQTELLDEKSHEQYLRRERLVETKQIREEERKRAQAMVSDVRRKLYKEKQQEIHELREKFHKEKEKESTYIIRQKDEEFRKAQLNWNREKDDLVNKLRVQFTNEIREETQKSHEKQVRKFEVDIEELKDQKKKLEESCKLAQDADKKKANQIRRMHSEHEQELAKLKRSSWQEGRKQMAEIRQLTNIIHQLEKKLGVESGHYIRLQLEKDSLRDKLDRIKGNESSGRKSPLSSSRTDLSSDLSMFSFSAVDDSDPLWLQIKQQKCTIAQLKQSLQDKNRRIDLLKQKLFKNRRFGGLMHRSMDDILSYESAAERDDCNSPVFAYSTGSSDTSSLNEESFQSDDNQDAEIIRRLQKEILQLQKAHSLLQVQTKSTVDAKRTQLEKEQLQNDLIEAQRQIDDLNKDLVESHDRNELLEFQLQESLQRNFDEGTYVSMFRIPTVCVDYQFSAEELYCSAEEVKAKLEELQNEKKPVLNRHEQLTLEQTKRLLENISTVKEQSPKTFSFNEVQSGGSQKDFLQLPVFDGSIHSDGSLDEHDTDPGLDEVFLERSKDELAVECDTNEQKSLEDVVVNADKSLKETDEKIHSPHEETSLFHENDHSNGSRLDTGVDSSVQCNILNILTHDEEILEICDEFKNRRFKKIPISNDIAVQTDMQKWDINNEDMVEDIISDDFNGNDVMTDDVRVADVIPNKVIAVVPDVEEDGVREKHDGEASEKTLLGLGWKDFVHSSELGADVKLLDCLVYEKEDVFIVICESYRKYCKEISSSDYTFDFDDVGDDITDDILETPLNAQTKHSANVFIRDNTILDQLDCKMGSESVDCEVADKNFQNLDNNKNVSRANEQAAVLSKTVTDIEKCEIGIQCDIRENERIGSIEKRCPDCARSLSTLPQNITNNTSETRSLSRDVDGLLGSHEGGEEATGLSDDDGADLIEEFQPKTSDFAFREMCDSAVQCDLRDVLDHSRCPYCGHCKTSCNDFAVQCELENILTNFHEDFDRSSSEIPYLCSCGQSKMSCSSDVAIQCEFLHLLSSSNGMLGEISQIPVVLQEDDGESLIKEVMALAKECSQNDALIDQHWNEVVQGQGLFNLIQDDENNEDGGQEEISPTNENTLDLYSEIPENEQVILRDTNSHEDEMPMFSWKEFRDVETQCGESLGKEEKAVQCSLLVDGKQFGVQNISANKDLTGEKLQDCTFEQEIGAITENQGEPRSGAIRLLPGDPESEVLTVPQNSNGEESRVIAEYARPNSTLNIDLNNVFSEMEAQSTNPILPVTLIPQEITPPAGSDENTSMYRQQDIVSRSLVEEPTITRTSKADVLNTLDETLQAFAAQDPEVCDDENTGGISRQNGNAVYISEDILHETKQSCHVDTSQQVDISVTGVKHITKQSNHEYSSQNGESSAISLSMEGSEVSEGEEQTSDEMSTSSQVTVENVRPHDAYQPSPNVEPLSPPPTPEESHSSSQNNSQPINDKHPPVVTDPSSDTSLSNSDMQPHLPDTLPPLPNTLPPTLPAESPPSVRHSDFDDDIEAILAEELYEDIGDLTPSEDENPVKVRPTLEQEIQSILESEDSSIHSEANTVLSMDSLNRNQTTTACTRESAVSQTVSNSVYHENTDVFNDETKMMSSFDGNDVISDDVSYTNDNGGVFEASDRLLCTGVDDFTLNTYSKCDRKSRWSDDSQRIMETKSTPVKRVVFQDETSEDSTTESSSVCEGVYRGPPPPVLPKPKYRSHSMNLPVTELPHLPTQSGRPNSMAAQKDIVDGYFPPLGLVTKRASEFNLGECDLLKERIVYLERQLKNKEHLLQSMRVEATEIETNAYIQKKEEDIKMMDESVRFLKVENQKKEKELVAKIGELNKCTFELEQLKSERQNAERQREILEDNVNSLQDRVSQLQSVQVQCQELRCKCDSLMKENAQLHEQVSRLHRADEEFVELERTISKSQDKLKELEDVKRERDDLNEQLKALKTQKDDLAQKGKKVESERNDFLMNNKLIQQQKENLEARNNALQRTNDTFKTKISNLEKESRDSQRKLFEIQRERDEASSQLRKLDAERNELRKRVNELIECKSEVKQYQSKSQDLQRELGYLRSQCKKMESQHTELSTELGNCLKERNRLVARTAELEEITRGNDKLEERFHTLKLKIAELTGQRDDAEVQLPALKAKLALVKKACKEKDEQLDKLKAEIRELKHSIASSALEDLSNMPSFGISSPEKSVKFRDPPDLNNNHVKSEDSTKGKRFVVLFDYDPERLNTTGHPEKELKLSEGDVITVKSDLDLNGYYMAELDGRTGLVSSLYIEEIDEYDMRKLKKQRQLNASKGSTKKPNLHSMPPRTLTNVPSLVRRPFVALSDYNPFTSSTSTRPDLELPLNAGEIVTVIGDVDANGYYTVEKGGRLAIVPSNLVKPSSPSLMRPSKLHFASPVSTTEQAQATSTLDRLSNHYPPQSSIVPKKSAPVRAAPPGSTPYVTKDVMEQFIRQSSVENIVHAQNTADVRRGEERATNISSGLPTAPRNLRVLRCVNNDALLLGWITPEVDELGRNNGQLVKGYKISANGKTKLDVESPYMAKALIENLDLTRPVELAIQTVVENGLCSEKSVTHFNEAVMMETTSVTTEDTSYLNSSLPYRTFVALFSYDPLKSSPNPNPTLELEFQEGDVIRVSDTSRTDGYYTGQVNGQEGLVPSNFIEEIAVATRPQHKKRDEGSASSLSPQKAKAMVALYDYNPTTHSPNKQPDQELGFRKGQIFRVLGTMRSDGFYEADINGQRGLVPATFLKPCKRKSTKSVNHTNGYASLPRRVQFAHEQDSRQMTAGYV